MIGLDNYTNKNKMNHNSKWPYVPNHLHRKLIVVGSGSGKTNTLLNLINNEIDIVRIYLYAKEPYQEKYQFLINERESTRLKHFNDPKAFIEYSNDMQDNYENVGQHNIDKKRKILIVFADMTADMINDKKTKSCSKIIVC